MNKVKKYIKKYIGYIFSVGFHTIFALIFLGISIDLSPLTPEFFDLTFTVVQAERISGETYMPPPPKTKQPDAEKSIAVKRKEIVDLPKRKTERMEEPEIPVIKKDKVLEKDSPARIGDKVEIRKEPERESTNDIISILGDRKSDIEDDNVSVSRSAQADQEEDTGVNISSVRSYLIEWVGSPREKLRGNLPAYPEGFDKTAVIKLRFKVFPNGTVGEIIPMQKGNIVLENLAINALKEWVFSQLEENAPQILQEGVVTFIYKLE